MNDIRETARARRRYLVETITKGGSLRMRDIEKMFRVSTQAVYNDLAVLRDLGVEIKTTRGVIAGLSTDRVNLIRQITFPSHQKEAGVAILSYFSRVLEQKYPDTDASVTIVQDGNTVRLQVESSRGEMETIEKTLSDYGQVVSGDLSPAEFLPNPLAVVELRNRLEVTSLELRLKEQSFLTFQKQSEQRIVDLERNVTELRSLVGTQLATVQSLSQSIVHLAEAERLSPAVSNALNVISELASTNYSKSNEVALSTALTVLHAENPTVFGKVKDSISSVGHSIVANLATPWVINLINAFPK